MYRLTLPTILLFRLDLEDALVIPELVKIPLIQHHTSLNDQTIEHLTVILISASLTCIQFNIQKYCIRLIEESCRSFVLTNFIPCHHNRAIHGRTSRLPCTAFNDVA